MLFDARDKVLDAYRSNIFPMKNINIDDHDDDDDDENDPYERALTPDPPTEILKEDLVPFGPTQGRGNKILPRKQMLQRLPILLV